MKDLLELNVLLNVLCLEDSLEDAEILNRILVKAGYLVSMDIVTGKTDYVDFLKNRNYDIILSNNSLPSFDAFAALKLALVLKPEIPFICVSGTIGEEKAVELLKQGASDYVIKDRMNRFIFAVQRALKEKEIPKERKKAEKTMQDIIDYNPMAIQILNAEGFTLKVNQAFMLLYGSKPPSDYSMFNDIQLNEKGFGKLIEQIKNGEVVHFPDMPFNPHDSVPEMPDVPAWIRTIVFPLLDSNGKPEKFVFIHENITERKKAESELIAAKEKAEESDRLKSAFLTNMSHEIRTPLNGILGFTELLKEPNLSSDDQQDFIQTIQISGARMLNTINSIVDISKIESGLTIVDIKETNLNEKIEFTYKFFKPEVEIKGLQFLFKNGLPTNEAIIKTDNEKVNGILTNLVRNAIKFTFDGSIEFGYEKKGEYLEFFVKDTGIGIPQKQQQLIFERFRQGSESHNRGYEGSGLGLSISKSYIEMLGGRIWVESEEGLGSTFYFTIPYNAVSEEKNIIENVISAEHKEVQLKKLKILVVEDDEISYSLLSKTLQKISKEVLHAITGVQAVEACRNNHDLDLVLMDIRMPVMDGNEATRKIRQFNKDVIIIAQTAYAFAGDREKAIEAGCNDYITKPVNRTLLNELIKKHIKK